MELKVGIKITFCMFSPVLDVCMYVYVGVFGILVRLVPMVAVSVSRGTLSGE